MQTKWSEILTSDPFNFDFTYLIFKSVEKGILKAKLKKSEFSVEQEFDTREQVMQFWDTI